ncbi:MAG: metal-dependent transcriptional regulator, partial [Flavobacteriales bacterium]|nr:metal-dependent transcriptional regulator [Flavobacteriales bacterium]
MLSKAVENYLKAIFSLSEEGNDNVSTNSIAKKLNTKASSVTDMLKKLTSKSLVNHEKYKGVSLTTKGKKLATNIVRKHRLWETFLVDKLHFNWDEVHDVAEQLEHI